MFWLSISCVLVLTVTVWLSYLEWPHVLPRISRQIFTVVSVTCHQSIDGRGRWTENVDYCLSFADQENKLPFSVSSVSVYIYISISIFLLYISIYIYISIYVFIHTSISIFTVYICCRVKQKTEAQAIFLNPFSVCSSCKRKFVVCPFVYEETNGNYPFSNGVTGLVYLWL